MTTKQCFPFFILIISLHLNILVQAQKTSSQDSLSKTIVSSPDALSSEDLVFEKTEVEASINAIAWRKHLETHLQLYLEEAARRGMKAGQYTVQVRFLVEKNGRISDVMALNDPGFGLGKAAVKVIKTGPRWTAGEVNGKKVRSYHTQPITFMISEK